MPSSLRAHAQGRAPTAVCALTPTRVGEGRLRQHDARLFDGVNALVLLSSQAPPRLWGHLLDAALEGFASGLALAGDGRIASRLHQAVDQAVKSARRSSDALLARQAPDVALLVLGVDGPLLHVVSAGPLRAFLWRAGTLRALTAHSERAHGMLRSPPSWSVEAVEPGDVLFAGNEACCSERALQHARACLAQAPVSLDQLLVHLNAAAGSEQVGGAVGAIQIPKF